MNWTRHEVAQLYRGIQRRDSRLDGRIWVGVRTTGIYCLPSCRGRKPNRENVVFFSSREEALRAGLRPCRKCHPEVLGGKRAMERRAVRAWLARLAESERPVGALAEEHGASPSRLYRAFRRHMGHGPRRARGEARLARACELLRAGRLRVADVAYEAGFGSLASFYRWFRRAVGLTPRAYQRREGVRRATRRLASRDA